MDRFEAFRDMEDRWRWRLLVGNDRVLASSDKAFDSQADALRAAEVVRAAAGAPVSEVAGVGPKELIARMIRREEARRLEVAVEDNRRAARDRPGRGRRTRSGNSPTRLRLVDSRRPA